MKIWGEFPKIMGVSNKSGSVRKTEKISAAASSKDVVSISNQAKDFQTVMKAVRNVPDVRRGVVEDIGKKYEAGTYDVSGKETADRILKSLIDKKV